LKFTAVGCQNRKIASNSDEIWPYSRSRSSKVIDLGVNRKCICDFLLYTVSQKTSNYSCYNYVKLPPNLSISVTM